jgi:hypothetical protein
MKGAIDTGRLRPNQGRTNQKLYFAKLQLERMQQLSVERIVFAWESEALSCREAVILHLHGAYLAFLQELVRFYKLQGPLFTSAALRDAMTAKGQVSPEIAVLQRLEQDSSSWLAHLQQAYAACLIAPDAAAPAVVETDADEDSAVRGISVVSVAADVPLSTGDVQALQSWHAELTAIIREFRREMAEW